MSAPADPIAVARSPYRLVLWYARNGDRVTLAVCAILIGLALARALSARDPVGGAILLVLALAGAVALRLLTEVLRLLADTLIPQ